MQAEFFMAGPEGVATHNIPKGEPNTATDNSLRSNTAISVGPLDLRYPQNGFLVVGWTGPGEWMNYKVCIYPFKILISHYIQT
jgi:hypothetical protein